jgi:hypothetical protein
MAQNITFTVPETAVGTQKVGFDTTQAELIKQAFGYSNVVTESYGQATKHNLAEIMDEGKSAMFDYSVFMPLVFETTTYNVLIDGQVKKDGASTEEMAFPVVLIEAARSKVIEVTSIEGKNGSVKEFSNLGHYDVSVKGILVGDDGNYPSQQVRKLARLDSRPVAINVTNGLLDYIGVKKLIIKRINWRSMQGYENLQAFELECISDEDVELVIENGL